MHLVLLANKERANRERFRENPSNSRLSFAKYDVFSLKYDLLCRW